MTHIGPFRVAKFVAARFLVLFVALTHAKSLCFGQDVSGTSADTKIRIADVRLVDRDGQAIGFANSAVADRIVAINFIYASCRTLCPFSSATFRLVQDKLGSRLGRDLRLISLTLDPTSDTPERLKEFSKQFEPAPGWLWLTGSETAVDSALQGLGARVSDIRDHAPLVLVGDAKFGRWTRLNATPSAALIESELRRLIALRERAQSSQAQERRVGEVWP